MATIADTDMDVYPLCLGGNVFGWTADRQQSFAVLDAYAAAGGNFVDTAEAYSDGVSEAILGEWLASRGNRDQMVVATKVWRGGLSAAAISAAAEDSLRRLGIDHIDLYYAHADDLNTPLEETLAAFDALVRAGKVRRIAASNYSADRLEQALAVSEREGLARYVAVQPHYNLLHRHEYEAALAKVVARRELGSMPYFALAEGFLTGKYRAGVEVDSPRAQGASQYLDQRGLAVLAALDEIAATVAATALAWLVAQPAVTAPIASARSTEQLADLLPMAQLTLSAPELSRLDRLSA